MAAPRSRTEGNGGPGQQPRRMSREGRREQLIDAAMPLVADQGIGAFSLDDVAANAKVTRNLLYHYFPRGRDDILVAVAERAGHELTDGWSTDESIPLAQRQATNFGLFFDHSVEPSLAWRIYRMARASTDEQLHAMIDQFQEVIVQGVSQNNLGTADPPPIARMAIKACLAFSETMLDEVRHSDVPRDEVLQLVAQTFLNTLEAVRARVGNDSP